MILGTGIDTVEIIRFQRFLDEGNQALLNRLFAVAELERCLHKKQKAPCLAARFAAKEAFVKALGTGLRDGLNWVEIEVVNDLLGKPSIKLSGITETIFNNSYNVPAAIHLSISHDGANAVAIVILEAAVCPPASGHRLC